MSANRSRVNPLASDMPLRDSIAMDLFLSELKTSGKMNSIDMSNAMITAHAKADEIINVRTDFLLTELDRKIQEAETQAQFAEIERHNERAMAEINKTMTPEKIQAMQTESEERKEYAKSGLFG